MIGEGTQGGWVGAAREGKRALKRKKREKKGGAQGQREFSAVRVGAGQN